MTSPRPKLPPPKRKTCKERGCREPVRCKGLCALHHSRDYHRRKKIEQGLVPPDLYPERHEANWQRGFKRLQTFIRRNGHSWMPEDHIERGFALGRWIWLQRLARRCRKLAAHRLKQLDALEGWRWTAIAARWDLAYLRVAAFAEREGNASVPQRHKEDGFGLGSWVSIQRAKYRRGELTKEQVKRLRSLPGWTWRERTGRAVHWQ